MIEDSIVRELSSEITGATYKLYIRLPKSYGSGDRRFPVVYLLDADYSFLLARNISEHLSDRDHLKELLLVGIANAGPLCYRMNRTRDYTPTHVPTGGYGPEYQMVSGGGPKFRDFLERELIPWVDREYLTVLDDHTLVGHSYGGLFGGWVLVTRPALFQRYILVSPSLWYDNHLVPGLEELYASKNHGLHARVYLCVGSGEIRRHDMVADMETFAARLRQRKYEGLALSSRVWQDETHNSIFPLCLSSGLRFVHQGR
ncbi:MAG: alpha/beta hydrolase-fold protein [Thermoanaerobaculia bacterium]